ncbi:TPA: ABC transporter ATP-binding protein [Staphylococcus delphini]|nr:ABC transporter ATP-binding protein [Staphylococcus pseudintermedius]HEC2191317.1 ABC transporter ATP-binding protein [Staphylococcus delphini]EGQ3746932.1 ABC transporter ATP-binding protein [Staphylococcus pseudintermedius]EGQ3903742.1 ABC transporter ATP-binding protein [Staphylococcus pseudintermedius]EHD0782648.1 ABC transporter ATP-binding protein [Staphylococcus pseudintermedius]
MIEIRNINKFYGTSHILKDINFTLNSGEIVCILGRNGAGKTTLIDCILDLNKHEFKEKKFFSKNFSSLDSIIKYKIGVQPQVAELFPQQTVYETLSLFNSFKNNKTDINRIIEIFDFNKIKNKKIKQLSVGQKQRLIVSLSFIGSPSIIILDEPTAGIDPQIKRLIWTQLSNFISDYTSIIYTTHDMNEAENFSDRIIIIDQGEIIEDSTPKSLLIKYNANNIEEVFIKSTGYDLREED